MNLFSYEDYKLYVSDVLAEMPKKGHGQYKKIAEFLGISTVLTSQIFNGDRDLSLEQAYKMTKYLHLTDLEKRYFLLLVQYSRAGVHDYKLYLKTQIGQIQNISKDLKRRIDTDKTLADYEKSIFYSDWRYSAIRLACDLPQCNSAAEISERLKIPAEKIKSLLEFLLKHGLCVENSGRLSVGSGRLHLEADSPLVKNRQISWRLRAMEKMEDSDPTNLFYTAPMTMSLKALEILREDLIKLIHTSATYIGASEAEELVGFNIDLFKI